MMMTSVAFCLNIQSGLGVRKTLGVSLVSKLEMSISKIKMITMKKHMAFGRSNDMHA